MSTAPAWLTWLPTEASDAVADALHAALGDAQGDSPPASAQRVDRALRALQAAFQQAATPDPDRRAAALVALHTTWAADPDLRDVITALARLGDDGEPIAPAAAAPPGDLAADLPGDRAARAGALGALANLLNRPAPPTDAEVEAALGPHLDRLAATARQADADRAREEIRASLAAALDDLVIPPFGS
jgi:hypothetical protein